jgi:hypothetical protein
MARVTAATEIVAVNIAVVAPSIAMTPAQAQRHQPTPIIAAHHAMRVRVAPLVQSRVMTPLAKVVVILAVVVATVATKVTAGKRALRARRQSTLPRALKQAGLRKHLVSHKAHAPKQAILCKPMINVTCKTAPRVSQALTTTTAAIQNASAVVVVAVAVSAVKTKVQALRTKMVQQACNSPTPRLSQALA